MHEQVLHTFTRVSAASAASPAPTQPSMKESTKGGGRRRRPLPFVEAARSAASFMDGCVGAGEAADAAETHVNVRKTCTCMHTQRATSNPQGLHGRAQSARRPNKAFLGVVATSKNSRSVRTICFPAVSRRDLCYASENEDFCSLNFGSTCDAG